MLSAWSRLRLATRMLILFSCLSLVSVGTVGSLALAYLRGLGGEALADTTTFGQRVTQDSASALERQATQGLLGLAHDQAAFSAAFFDRVEADVNIAAEQVARAWAWPLTRGASSDSTLESPAGPGRVAWSFPPTADANAIADDLTRAAQLEGVFPSIDAHSPDITSIYLGTEAGLLFFSPFDLAIPADFDPRVRPWYRAAKATDRVVWSELFIDAGGAGLVIAASRAVWSTDGTLIGAVGADVSIERLAQRVLATRLGDQGYGFLIDEHGNVLAHPALTADGTEWEDVFHTDNLLRSDVPGLPGVAAEMVAGRSGAGVVTIGKDNHIVAYAPVPKTRWSIGLVVHIGEVTAPSQAVQTRIEEAVADTAGDIDRHIRFAQASFAVVLLGLVLLAVGATILVARTIVRPVERVSDAAQALERGELGEEQIATLAQTSGRDEVATLSRVFARMAAEVRAREAQLRRQVEALRIEIDQTKKAKQVAEITETDYFQTLQQQARAMRAQAEAPIAPQPSPREGAKD